jgi:hypothetical protein
MAYLDTHMRKTVSTECLTALGEACPGMRYLGRPCLECVSAHKKIPGCGSLQPSDINVSHGTDDIRYFCGVGFPSFGWQSPLAE